MCHNCYIFLFCFAFRGGNLSDITSAGSIYHFLLELHKQFGPIASFWWGKTYTVSIASPELFEEQLELTERPGKLLDLNLLRIYHEYEGGIEITAPNTTVWHHEAC